MRVWREVGASRPRVPGVGRRVVNGCDGRILVLVVKGARESRVVGILDVIEN